MPCDCSHMEPTKWEAESRKIAKLILRVKGPRCPAWIADAASNYYGKKEKVHELTALLCSWCRDNEEIIYSDPRDRTLRNLADWWEDHQEADKAKEEV